MVCCILNNSPSPSVNWSTQASQAFSLSRLAYKEAGALRWIRYIGPPSHFRCPEDVAVDVSEYCHRLTDIFFGVHYLARVSAWFELKKYQIRD